jgi:sugar lactone lactonase YvrE
MGIAVDTSGNVLVADTDNNLIRKITPFGVVTTLAGNGGSGDANGIGTAAQFFCPAGVAVDTSNNVYVTDGCSNLIRKITPAGMVTTLAGNGSAGSSNGPGTVASFDSPRGIAVDASGNVYVADMINESIRKITPAGIVSTLAGNGSKGYSNGIGSVASFYYPMGVAVDASGNVYVTDSVNAMVRKITPDGTVTTLAGNGNSNSINGIGAAASFNGPSGIATDALGNIYVSTYIGSIVNKITPQ